MNPIILSAATTRPALAPILFPAGMDDLLTERRDAADLARNLAHRIPAHIIAHQAARVSRLNARIAQVVS